MNQGKRYQEIFSLLFAIILVTVVTMPIYADETRSSEFMTSSDDTKTMTAVRNRKIPVLTLLVQFSDVQFTTSIGDWEDFVFGTDNSVKTYYDVMSKGSLELIPVQETNGIANDGLVNVTLDEKHPISNMTTDFSPHDFFALILKAAKEDVDFASYDLDGNGIVDTSEMAIVVVVAGYESNMYLDEDQAYVSGVSYSMSRYIPADNVFLGKYSMTGELYPQDFDDTKSMATIGIYAHEFGHLLGLPDLYDTDYSSLGLDFHSLMANGENSFDESSNLGQYPVPMIAWSRVELGFVEPEIIEEDGIYTLYGDDAGYNVIKIPTQNPDVYYLLENRQLNGYGKTWRMYMSHGGIAIWKINDQVIKDNMILNTVEADENNLGIELIEAGGTSELKGDYLPVGKKIFHNHYYSAGDIDELVTEEGIDIEVLDKSQKAMKIKISFPK